MADKKVYRDSEGNPRSIAEMVRKEPYWAVNKLKEGEAAIERVKVLEESDKIFQKVIDKLIADNHGMTPSWLLDLMPQCGIERETI